MRLGVVSAILGSMDFFEAVDCVSSLGYTCMEAACWPGEKADRRYAGVQHINVRALDKAAAKRISSYCTDRNVAISALAIPSAGTLTHRDGVWILRAICKYF